MLFERTELQVKPQSQRRKKPNIYPKNSLLLSAVTPLLLAVLFFGSLHCPEPVSKLALVSASFVLPQGSVQVLKNDLQAASKTPAADETAEIIAPIAPQAEPKPTANGSITDTPQDILEMQRAAEALTANAERGGTIVEKQYDSANATAVFKNITVRNTTPSHGIDIQSALEKPVTLSVENKAEPTVLIFHTHTTECYEMLNLGWYTADYVTRSEDPARNMVRVGTALCEELEKMGIGVIHDTQIHDAKYTGAYDRSRESIEKIMQENPSIKVVIDVHRDAIKQSDGTRVKPTATVNGKKAAQIMIIAGCEDGKVTSFPSWEENLTFALRLQEIAETEYPGLMRPLLFSARKYNMDVTPCSVLLEMGSDSNTLEEAEYSGRLIGTALGKLVSEYEKK